MLLELYLLAKRLIVLVTFVFIFQTACGVTGQEQAEGVEEDHQPARGGVGQEGGRGQGV